MTAFREKIREQVANQPLQLALDANAERRIRSRLASFASLPDWQERRQRAHAVRAEVIARLDQYLAQFVAQAERNGVTVHQARDSAQAVQIALAIIASSVEGNEQHTDHTEHPAHLRQSPVLIAKSKSMVSEEIELNHALESAGHRVVETDLGEYIVQLRGERPAHIITPAVHLRRHEVGQLFHEKLGIPYTEDIPTLTNTARRVLREVFLTADVGISGVNFGVAETGGLCLVTNEGNGRMVTTLPPLHVALMGIERLVPTLDDLALMLSLLPRSATGQKLSVYTQLLNRPADGQQRHIILLDNGRRAVRESPLAESLYCIRCGACLNACPVFREIGGHGYLGVTGRPVTYSGPIGSVISAGLLGGAEFANLAQASSLCGACKEACPVDIDLPKLLLRVRAGHSPSGAQRGSQSAPAPPTDGVGLPGALRLALVIFTRTAGHPRLFAFAQRVLGWLSAPLGDYLKLPAFTGWGLSKNLSKPAAKPFRARWNKLEGPPAAETPASSAAVMAKPVESEAKSVTPVAAQAPLLESFTAELTAVGGLAVRVQSDQLHERIIAFLRSRSVDFIHLEPGLLDEAPLVQAGIRVTHDPDPSAQAGLTRALCGTADTGSILVADGPGRPLQASLLPEIHLAILPARDVLPSLADALGLPQVKSAAATVVITGPSRTGDIEMTHTIGVHGPGDVQVFIVDG